jgi:peptide/nickel transport system permease protein
MKLMATLLRRLVYSAVLLLAVIILNFLLLHLAPGDPAETLVGEMGGATEEILAQIKAEYGLDESLLKQLSTHIRKMAQLDLGHSFTYEREVSELILQRMPATILLVMTAMVVAVAVGTVLGVISARNPQGVLSHVVTVLSLAGYSAPVFWTGIMLLILFSYFFPLFPSFGMRTIGGTGGLLEGVWDVVHHLVLPVVTLSSIYIAAYSRLSRASMLDVLGSDYIRTARSKGLSEHVVVYKHALKNALLPVVTMAGLQFSQLVAGAVVVETVFSWPGMGLLA